MEAQYIGVLKNQLGTFVEKSNLLELLSIRKETFQLRKSLHLTLLDAGYSKGRFALLSQQTPFRSGLLF